MVWPLDLAYFYPHPFFGILAWQTLLAAAVVAGLSLVGWRSRRRAPAMLIGWLWYLVTCFPVLGLIQIGLQGAADRYTYVPLVGVFFAVTFALAPTVSRRMLRGARAVGAVLLVAFAVLTWRQTRVWADSSTLTAHALKVTPGNFFALNDLGTEQVDAGRYLEAIEQLDQSVRDAAALQPLACDFLADSHTRVGLHLARQGQTADALRHIEEALRLDPTNRKANLALGLLRKVVTPGTERVP